jgi:hypothetical protein
MCSFCTVQSRSIPSSKFQFFKVEQQAGAALHELNVCMLLQSDSRSEALRESSLRLTSKA